MEKLDCSYHVYKMIDEESNRKSYVADGAGTRSHEYNFVGPEGSSDLSDLPKALMREHLDYLKRHGFEIVAKLEDMYMTFSFTPPCQKVFQLGSFYSVYPLDEKERDQFCKGIREVYEILDRSISLECDGNPLDD